DNNQAVTVTATYFPNPARPNQPITFTVQSSDPDDQINTSDRCRTVNSWGDGSSEPSQPDCPRCPAPGRYGPWTPPAKKGSSQVDYQTHTFAPGDYTVTFRRVSGDPCPNETDPYA